MAEIQQHHRVGDMAVELVLLGGERYVDQCPQDNANAAVVEELKVDWADARVELNAHKQVVDVRVAELVVFAVGWRNVGCG